MRARTIERYLARQIFAAVGFVLLGFLALLAFFDLIHELGDLGRGNYQLRQVFLFVLLSLAAAAVVHALYGGLRVQGRRLRAAKGAQVHLFLLLGVFVLLKAVAYWFDRYGIDFSQRGTVTTGASYTDVNAVLPAKTVLAVIAILCAVLFFAGAARHSAMLPAVGLGLLVLSAILVGGVYPAVIQQFVVFLHDKKFTQS